MKRGGWRWFFLLLVLLAAAGIIIPIVYNLRLQLKPEQLSLARERWRQLGTPNYDLEYAARYDQEPEPDEIEIKVRGGKVVRVIMNGKVLRFDDAAGLALGLVVSSLPEQDFSSQTVEGLFDQMEKRMREDAGSPQRRNYATASFDSRDGHPIRYVHRAAGTKQRIEWQIRLTRAEP